jgi:hypothetical protein
VIAAPYDTQAEVIVYDDRRVVVACVVTSGDAFVVGRARADRPVSRTTDRIAQPVEEQRLGSCGTTRSFIEHHGRGRTCEGRPLGEHAAARQCRGELGSGANGAAARVANPEALQCRSFGMPTAERKFAGCFSPIFSSLRHVGA